MKHLIFALATVLLNSAAALAQQTTSSPAPPPPSGTYDDANCGAWVNDVWVPNANCTAFVTVIRHDSLAGTITAVKGHLVTIQQTNRSLVLNDQPALDRKQTGKVAVGRQIVAYGYWQDGTFYATAIY
jgi:hypothetical protein